MKPWISSENIALPGKCWMIVVQEELADQLRFACKGIVRQKEQLTPCWARENTTLEGNVFWNLWLRKTNQIDNIIIIDIIIMVIIFSFMLLS